MQRSPYESITVEESFLRGDPFPGRSYEKTTASAVRQRPPLEPPTTEASLSRAQQPSNVSKSPYNQRRRIIGPPIRLSPYESQTIEESLLNAPVRTISLRSETNNQRPPTQLAAPRRAPYKTHPAKASLPDPSLRPFIATRKIPFNPGLPPRPNARKPFYKVPKIEGTPVITQPNVESLRKSPCNRNEAAIRPIPTSFRGFPYESFTIEESLVNPTLS
ncbi:hypothetical protein D8B26_006235 [Coccidioides posadasii str. Silveira]|uniref:Uncharacterized protein n=2 Tax=Coccidioides posadasii TaxID=199306 RepID=E9CSH6_COCPS|nr:conserved hypothetical protein [Coccidioides posadasii str. Silveira]KMM67568.1 hypothetical protein CPAG_03900 [Coccidioides posadasii RMSCC 3488]QVM11588.1 hypothetical protein D8B26_006235 [Coccidioides posadasii str. Silveira]